MAPTHRLFSVARRAWQRLSVARSHATDEMLSEAPAFSGELTLVAALCLCVLGDGGTMANDRWPPRSVPHLVSSAGRSPVASTFGMTTHALSCLLEQGLAALDESALRETGRSFAHIGRDRQLRTLFELESGRLGLSRPLAAAFVDAFLALAAQAYLCDALETRSPTRADAQRSAHAARP